MNVKELRMVLEALEAQGLGDARVETQDYGGPEVNFVVPTMETVVLMDSET